MDDPIQEICQILAETLRSEPSTEIDRIVSRVKAELTLNSNLAIALQSDSRMVQINHGEAKGYQVLVTGGIANIGDQYHFDTEALNQALGKLLEEFAKQKQTGTPQNLPRSGVVQFIGRDEKLTELHSQLQRNDPIALTALQGMGGIGKTELALQYAIAQFKEVTYPGGICWLRARDQEIATQILSYAQAQIGLVVPDMDLAGQISYCWRNWAEGDVLVVLDDVTAYDAVAPYLPPSDPRFKVLMTTRLKLGSTVRTFPVEELDEGSAIVLLESFVGTERVQSQLDEVRTLCQRVGYLPLGLELLGRFLARKPDWRVGKLLEQLASKSLTAKPIFLISAQKTALKNC